MIKPILDPITKTEDLRALCGRLAHAEFLTVDTEFNRTTTYYSQLCVVQVADDEAAYAIDALAPGLDLSPLYDLMADPGILKVFHAARQDLEIFYHATGSLPGPLFDTQIAAMVCGYGEQVGYETLVKSLTRGKLDKAIRFTDWSRRPLTVKQIEYALGDVIYLRKIYQILSQKVEDSGRMEWLSDELAIQMATETYDPDPRNVWRRVKTRSSNRRFLGRVRELAAWRELQARERDIPKTRVIRDEVLLEVAAHPPETMEQLRKIRTLPKRYGDQRQADKILNALRIAAETPENELPEAAPQKSRRQKAGPMLDLLKVLLKYRCEETEVASKLVASGDELNAFANGQRKNIRFLGGWRREIFGQDAIDLVEGKIALTVNGDSLNIAKV